MAAANTRRKATKLIAAETPRTTGSLHVLPATAPVAFDMDDSEPTSAAAFGGFAATVSGSASAGGATVSASATISLGGSGGGGGGGGKATGADSTRQGDPDVAYSFQIKIGEKQYGEFAEVGGLSWKAEAIPVRSGGNNEWSHNLRGPGKFEPLTLKRGWFASKGEFYDMMRDSLAGTAAAPAGKRQNVTIVVLNRAYQPIAEYQVSNAFITEYSGLSLNAMSSAVGFEQIRMSYDYFVYKAG